MQTTRDEWIVVGSNLTDKDYFTPSAWQSLTRIILVDKNVQDSYCEYTLLIFVDRGKYQKGGK